jgi:hypothetical protein
MVAAITTVVGEDDVHYADNGLDSADHCLLDGEDLPDRGDHFPGQS